MFGQLRLSFGKKLIQPGHLRFKRLSPSQLELELGNPLLKPGYDQNLVPVETPVLVEQSKEKVKKKKKKKGERDQNKLTMV
jgi:hypothetical protein